VRFSDRARIAALLLAAGYCFSELPVNHRVRLAGESKYTNWDRALRGVHDLIGVSWLLKRKVRFDVTTATGKETS
jgi:dolichol-phosphate mannosyltransferase